MGFLSDAMTWLDSTLKTSDGETVTYQRGSDSVSITAVIGQSDMERDSGDGLQTSFRSIDFLITADDLILSGVTVKPARGDRIIRNVGSVTRTYQVLPSEGEQHYAYSGPDGETLRVHTKLIREE